MAQKKKTTRKTTQKKKRTSTRRRKKTSWLKQKWNAVKKSIPFFGKKKKRRKKKSKTPRGLIVKWMLILFVWGVIISGLGLVYFIHDLPDVSKLRVIEKSPSITLVSQDGVKLMQMGDLYGEYLTYRDIPRYLKQAVLATEDRRFYSHFGIDIIGLIRAFYTNYQAGRVVQGGSTITQQLAKIVFLTPERTLKRKVQEAIIALWLEYKLTKEEILTIYLNRVYLGAGNYGVDAASRFYFGHSAKKLHLREAALLAGLLKAPTRYAPTNNRELSSKRTNQVLINMEHAGYLSAVEARLASQYVVDISGGERRGALKSRYFADYVMEQLPRYVGRIDRDLIVTTTLDPELQQHAEAEVATVIDLYATQKSLSQAAVVTLSPTGEILAMVGGKSYQESQFNRATKALRQPGSAFKLFVYLAALEQGFTPYVTMNDAPITIDGWSPKNYSKEYKGEVTLHQAFAESINTVAVRLAKQVGVKPIIKQAKSMGIHSPLKHDLGLALGTNEVTLLELTSAYAHLANRGNAVLPYSIISIKERSGKQLYQRRELPKHQVISSQALRQANHMLQKVITDGTGKNAKLSRRQTAGKTGTSQDFRDAWFIGYTADMVTGIWMGNDDNTPMKNVSGGSLPAFLWKNIMDTAHAKKPFRSIPTQRTIRPSSWFDWGSLLDGDVKYEYPGQKKR